MLKKEFIAETSNYQKLKIFIITVGALFALISLSIPAVSFFERNNVSSYQAVKLFFKEEIKSPSMPSLFYLAFIGDLFFIPLPTEPLMILSLQKGNPIVLSLIILLAGLLAGNLVNYFAGEKLSRFVFVFLSRKKVYASRRWVHRYGSYAIFIFNLVPVFLPSPLLSFGLGIAKYNFFRFLIFTFLGNIIKFAAIIALYFLFKGQISFW